MSRYDITYLDTVNAAPNRTVLVDADNPIDTILLVGSCRLLPYYNYLKLMNKLTEVKYRIYFISPIGFHFCDRGSRIDVDNALIAAESNPTILRVLDETTVFIHEHLARYGMFNTATDSEKNIFQFGLDPRVSIGVPNYNDHFLLYNEVFTYALPRKEQPTESDILDFKNYSTASLDKFYRNTLKTDVPEMADYFLNNWTKKRLTYTYNHISSLFSMYIFKRILPKFLDIELSSNYWKAVEKQDMYYSTRDGDCTRVTQYDRAVHGIEWT